jgi:hypothetical protein
MNRFFQLVIVMLGAGLSSFTVILFVFESGLLISIATFFSLFLTTILSLKFSSHKKHLTTDMLKRIKPADSTDSDRPIKIIGQAQEKIPA